MRLFSFGVSCIQLSVEKVTSISLPKPRNSLILLLTISANLLLAGCTGSHSASEPPGLNSDSGGQRLPADISQSQSGEAAGFRSSDDPNLVLPEPSMRGKAGGPTEAVPLTTKSRKPASTR